MAADASIAFIVSSPLGQVNFLLLCGCERKSVPRGRKHISRKGSSSSNRSSRSIHSGRSHRGSDDSEGTRRSKGRDAGTRYIYGSSAPLSGAAVTCLTVRLRTVGTVQVPSPNGTCRDVRVRVVGVTLPV
jgi:hypothetical protein